MGWVRRVGGLRMDTTPLRTSRDFRLLFWAGTVFYLGGFVSYVAVPYQLYTLTGSNLAVGLVGLVELVPLAVRVTEYQMMARRCPSCGKRTRADLPAGVPRRPFGTRLTAVVALLSGRYRLSRREVRQLLQDLWAVRVSLGAVVRAMSCRRCSPHPPFARPLGATRRSWEEKSSWKRERNKVTVPWVAEEDIGCAQRHIAAAKKKPRP